MGVVAGLYMCDVVKKVHVRYLISWWVLVTISRVEWTLLDPRTRRKKATTSYCKEMAKRRLLSCRREIIYTACTNEGDRHWAAESNVERNSIFSRDRRSAGGGPNENDEWSLCRFVARGAARDAKPFIGVEATNFAAVAATTFSSRGSHARAAV